MLYPQRPILIEGGNAIRQRYEPRARTIRRGFDECDDGLFGRAVISGRHRIDLRQGLGA
jgi:hypothetical protein